MSSRPTMAPIGNLDNKSEKQKENQLSANISVQ
jgi:hypothetical protein